MELVIILLQGFAEEHSPWGDDTSSEISLDSQGSDNGGRPLNEKHV